MTVLLGGARARHCRGYRRLGALAPGRLPADELIQASLDADLAVVGSRGAGRLRRLVLGSVSAEVSQHARCPVVVIPGQGRV